MRPRKLAVRIFWMLLLCSIASATAVSQDSISGKRNDKLTAEDKDKSVKAQASVVKMSPYMRDCRAAGVPLPPVWGDSGWGGGPVGFLPKEKSFDSAGKPITEVWIHSSDLGICYALPRKDAGGTIKLLGIICQGTASSKACFWDNEDASKPPGSRIEGAATDGMDPADIRDGYTLMVAKGEICTECHRGENVFNIYPGTALDQRNTGVAHAPYSPVAQSGWTNPESDYTLPSKKERCASCHELPKLSEGYCGLLKGVIETGIMPDLQGGTTTPDYLPDVEFLADRCNELVPGLWVFDEPAQERLGYKKKP